LNPGMGRNVSEDLEFTLRCVLQKPAGIVVRPTVDICRHGHNYTQDWIRTLAGSIAILKYAHANYRLPAEYATALRQEIISKSILAIDCCFTQRRFDEIGEFAENLSGNGTPLRTAIKIGVSHQPKALAFFLGSVLAASAAALPRSMRRSR
jgi:hypothetical protein